MKTVMSGWKPPVRLTRYNPKAKPGETHPHDQTTPGLSAEMVMSL
jgi:hypothetical protein